MEMTEDFFAEIDEFLLACGTPNLPTILEEDTLPQLESGDYAKSIAAEEVKMDVTAKRKQARAEQDRIRRQRCHKRQKHERESLKAQIQELSAFLEKETRNPTAKNDILLASSWGIFAKLQREMRLAAEEKQLKLCAAVAAQKHLNHQLSALVNQFDSFTHVLNGECSLHQHTQVEDFDTDIYNAYMRELQGLFEQTDDVFRAGKRDVGVDDARFELTWRKEGKFFEYGDKRLLPFDYPMTCQILWLASQMVHRQEARVNYDRVDDPDNTFAVKFRITSRLKSGETVSVIQSAVSRRYEEKDRVVFVWREFVEGEGPFSGMNSDEAGWCVLKRSTSGTEVEICVRNTPMHLNFTAKSDQSTDDEFTGFVLTSKAEDYAEIVSILEKLHTVN